MHKTYKEKRKLVDILVTASMNITSKEFGQKKKIETEQRS